MSWLLVAAALGAAGWLLKRKKVSRWLVPAVTHGVGQWFVRRPTPVHVLVALADHFEPSRGGADPDLAEARLHRWLERLPEIGAAHRDADGRPPRHTFFYPFDEWRDGELARLGQLCFDGLGEIELHLHHDGDTSAGLRRTLTEALAAFNRYGALLTAETTPRATYGFVHGNWCLDNSRPDGRWCGVTDELRLLAETGCYADFTLPTPDETQPRMVNRIYRATDDPTRPFSHDRGRPLSAGARAPGDLLLIPGPLGVNWRDWHHRWYPALERGELAHPSPVTPARVDFWLRCGIGVRGRPDWLFVKLHCHGCQERDQEDLLGELRHELHRLLETRADTGRYVLHYVTCRELANLALAAEEGCSGDPNEHRDHVIAPPVNTVLRSAQPVAVRALSEAAGEILAVGDAPVDWRLKVGPLARLAGRVKRLAWSGGTVTLEAEGEVTREAR